MKYYIWKLDKKTNVPFKILETIHSDTYLETVASLIEDGEHFATRVEEK